MPRRKRKNKRNSSTVPRILQIDASVRVRHRYRFQKGSAASGAPINITRANLLNLMLVGSGAFSGYRIIAGIKLKRIEIISTFGTGSTTDPVPISLEWLSNYGPSAQSSDTASNVSVNACIKTSPPKQSLASFWSLTGVNESEVLCKLILPQNASHTVDLWVDIVLMDDETPVTVVTAALSTAAQFYLSYMDGQSTSVLVPVSYTAIK
jgi:hypothetical protein